jgi:pyridoxal phosphate phosphatase PHOSPHO2
VVDEAKERTGEELDAFLKRNAPAFDRVIYVGDGANDFCPVLRLRRYVFISLSLFRHIVSVVF